MKWAMWQQDVVKDPTARHVLLVLANYANEHGDAYPSVKTLHVLTHLGIRTIREKLDLLTKLKVLGEGDQSIAAHYVQHNGVAPKVYRLAIKEVRSDRLLTAEIAESLAEQKRGTRKTLALQGAAAIAAASKAADTSAGAALLSDQAPENLAAVVADAQRGELHGSTRQPPSLDAAAAHNPSSDPSSDPGSDPGKSDSPLPGGGGTPDQATTVPKKSAEQVTVVSKPMSIPEFTAELVKLGVTPQTAADWMAVRKAKKAAHTLRALEGFIRNVDTIGCTHEAAARLCAERSWIGFDSTYAQAQALKPGKGPSSAPMSYAEADLDRKRRQADEALYPNGRPNNLMPRPLVPQQTLLPGADGVMEA